MKKIFIWIFCYPFFCKAQIENVNLLKTSLSGFLIANYTIGYERKILPHFTIYTELRYSPAGGIPLIRDIDNIQSGQLSKNNDFDLYNTTIANNALTIECRYYPKISENFKGFYIAPYYRATTIDIFIPQKVKYTYVDGSIFEANLKINGSLKADGFGLALGIQKKITNRLFLDFVIFGLHFGKENSNFSFTSDKIASIGDNQFIKNNIENFKTDLEKVIKFDKFEYSLNPDSGNLEASSSWIGLRGLGLSLAYTF